MAIGNFEKGLELFQFFGWFFVALRVRERFVTRLTLWSWFTPWWSCTSKFIRDDNWCIFIFVSKYICIYMILLMEEILHQLIASLSHNLQCFLHPRRCRISSSTVYKVWWSNFRWNDEISETKFISKPKPLRTCWIMNLQVYSDSWCIGQRNHPLLIQTKNSK